MNIIEKKFVSIGGGIGSFCWVDALRVHGVSKKDISVIGIHETPYRQFKVYCDNSGLHEDSRIRSDSSARPDNFWGFPGYALSEVFDEIKKWHLTKFLKGSLPLILRN